MTDKPVTHADLPLLRQFREDYFDPTPTENDQRNLELLDRLIAAAEADAPPLPEGWVVLTSEGGDRHRIVWHEDGRLWAWDDGTYPVGKIDLDVPRDRLAPLRPTVTREDIKRAHLAWLKRAGSTLDATRAAFEAAGIEVQS